MIAIQLLEYAIPLSSVRLSVNMKKADSFLRLYFSHTGINISPEAPPVRGSHGLSTRRARKDEVKRPEGPPARSRGPEGP